MDIDVEQEIRNVSLKQQIIENFLLPITTEKRYCILSLPDDPVFETLHQYNMNIRTDSEDIINIVGYHIVRSQTSMLYDVWTWDKVNSLSFTPSRSPSKQIALYLYKKMCIHGYSSRPFVWSTVVERGNITKDPDIFDLKITPMKKKENIWISKLPKCQLKETRVRLAEHRGCSIKVYVQLKATFLTRFG